MKQCNNATPKSPPKFLRNLGGLTGQAMQRGVAIYLVIVIMFVLFSISLGISTLLVGQIRIIRGMGYSVVALYAADTGIERVLYAIRKKGYCSPPPLLPDRPFVDIALGNGATYTVTITDCNSVTTINSKGIYQGTSRAIEISY